MVSRTKMEIASLIFAVLSLLGTAVGFLWSGTYIVRVCMSMVNLTTVAERNVSAEMDAWYLNQVMYVNIANTSLLSIMLVAFVYSTILMKGLLSKKSSLVKAYFVYGATGTTLILFFAFIILLLGGGKIGAIMVAVGLLYSLILWMIKKTYLQLATNERDQCFLKNVDEEKSITIKL